MSIDRSTKVVLVLSESPSSLSSGGGVIGLDRAYMLNELCDLQILFVDWDGQGPANVNGLLRNKCLPLSKSNSKKNALLKMVQKIKNFINRKPWFCRQFNIPNLNRQIRNYLENFDAKIIIFDNIPSTVAWDSFAGLKRAYFAHNVEADIVKFTKPSSSFVKLFNFEPARMKSHERRILRESDAVACFTDKDASALSRLVPGKSIFVIPPAFRAPIENSREKAKDKKYVIMPTNAAWHPNILSLNWFFSEVFPSVNQDIEFVLTGKDHNDYLKSLDQRFNNVKYPGLLSRVDYEGLMKNAELFVNPTICGSGFQIKLIEAMRFELPIISTKFSNHVGESISSTDNPLEMAEMINSWMRKKTGILTPAYADLFESSKQNSIKLFDCLNK